MNTTTCPRCNIYLAPGAQVCPNCNLLVQQYHPYAPTFPVAQAEMENPKEKLYRKILVGISIALAAEYLLTKFQEKMYSWYEIDVYSWMKPLMWLTTIAWAGLPLFVALILPKKNSVRVLLVVLSSIWVVYRLSTFVYDEFIYNPWEDYDDYSTPIY